MLASDAEVTLRKLNLFSIVVSSLSAVMQKNDLTAHNKTKQQHANMHMLGVTLIGSTSASVTKKHV